MKTTIINWFIFILLSQYSVAQFNWNSWTNGALSGTISTGSCSANVTISQSDATQLFTNGSPSYKTDATWGNGNGLFISHNWTGVNKSTIVTINFTTAVINPCFTIDDINTRPTCYRGCGSNWSDEVQVSGTRTSGSGLITITSNSTASSVPINDIFNVTLSSGNTVATVSAKPNCHAASSIHYNTNFCLSGTFTQIVITYRSGPWFSRSALATLLTEDCGSNSSTCRSELTNNCSSSDGDPDNQHIKIGSISTSNCFTGMPVEFGDFYHQCEDDHLELNWFTQSEINNDKFQILESNDGIHYNLILEEKGAGTTQGLNSYSYEVPYRSSLNKYYKLRQIDFDGTLKDLKTIYVSDECLINWNEIKIYPNPITDKIYIEKIKNNTAEKIVISVKNIEGKIIYYQEMDNTFENHFINTSYWSNGIYLIEVIGSSFMEHRKIQKI